MNDVNGAALEIRAVRRTYIQGMARLEVLRGANLDIKRGEIVGLVGPSGSGKSTLLHIAGLLERPDAGEVLIAGEITGPLSDQRRTELRRIAIGFVYQFHHLLPEFSALENVVLPQMVAGRSKREAEVKARALLADVGLVERATHRPARLSGGEQQRVAIARALANEPMLLLADEPTGNLDQTTSGSVFELLLRVVRGAEIGALIATHNLALAARMDRIVSLSDGRLQSA